MARRGPENSKCLFRSISPDQILIDGPIAFAKRDGYPVTKGAFAFAAAGQVPRLMRELESGPLRDFTPCRFSTADQRARAMAIVHAELVLVHPFRDGNGRCARLLAVLMGLQAGLPVLDSTGVRGHERARYVAAVYAALDRNYEPMIAVFRGIIARTKAG